MIKKKFLLSLSPAIALLAFAGQPGFAAELLTKKIMTDSDSTQYLVKTLKNEHSTVAISIAGLSEHKLRAVDETVTLFTTDDETVVFKKTSSQEENGKLVWQGNWVGLNESATQEGNIEQRLLNSATLVRNGDNIAGSFRLAGQLYQLWPLGGNKVAVVKVDESEVNEWHEHEDEQDIEADTPLPAAMNSRACEVPPPYAGDSKPPSIIRVALVTTEQSRKALANTDLNALATLAFSEANQGTRNSNVGIVFDSAGILHADYSERGTFSNMWSEMFTNSGSALSQQIQQYRDKHRAHLVVMLAQTTSSAGTGTNDANKNSAFSVIRYSNLTGTYTFAHEMGHNLGASHDLDQYGGVPKRLPCYRHGYKHESSVAKERWRTIMSYGCKSGSCGRLNMFSNPRMSFQGVPVGSEQYEDNARRLNERREEVASFYPWM